MARAIDGDKLVENLRLIAMCWSVSPYVSKEKHNGAVDMIREAEREVKEAPTLTPPNEPLTWEELTAETKINPVYSMKYGWIFPNTVKDEPYKQVWFFTSKGFANTELFYRDTFYRHPPEGDEDT